MDDKDLKRYRILVSGRVQDVCYRYYTQTEASALALTGYVRNLPDTNVEIVAEGPEKQIQKLLSWTRKGPPMANVTGVTFTKEEYLDEFISFEIR